MPGVGARGEGLERMRKTVGMRPPYGEKGRGWRDEDFFSSRLHAACMYWNRSKASVSWRRTKVLVLSNASCARGPQHVRQF